ncbi:hypothetical protein PA7559_03750 [Pseudoalteromonas distincta]
MAAATTWGVIVLSFLVLSSQIGNKQSGKPIIKACNNVPKYKPTPIDSINNRLKTSINSRLTLDIKTLQLMVYKL